MPKHEFEAEDPLELSGVVLFTPQDTTDEMAACFIEEFLRMGYRPEQVLALFRDPQYLGPHRVFQRRGEARVREQIRAVFTQWGQAADWLTPRADGTAGTSVSPAVAAPTTDPDVPPSTARREAEVTGPDPVGEGHPELNPGPAPALTAPQPAPAP